MLKINPPDYKFCPMCGSRLYIQKEEGRERKLCKKCDWKFYPHVASASVAVIKKGNEIILVKRARENLLKTHGCSQLDS